jgi:hypothetical protein
MTAKSWRFAAACVIVLSTLLVSGESASAGPCRTLEDEQAEAAANGYVAVRDYAGAEAKTFLAIFNRVSPPGIADIYAERLRVFGREDLSFVIISFLKQGCLAARLKVPILIYRQVDLETARHLAGEGGAS